MKALLFDCWYTLFTADLRNDLTAVGEAMGVPFDRHLVKAFEAAFMLQPYQDLHEPAQALAAAFGCTDPTVIDLAVRRFTAGLDRQRPYDDTLMVLEQLRDSCSYQLALITNSFSLSLGHLRRQFNLDEYFDLILPSYEVGVIKPDPAIFQEALRRLAVKPDDAMMIGDSLNDDVQAARAQGLQALLLDRTNKYPHETHRITSLTDLLAQLQLAK